MNKRTSVSIARTLAIRLNSLNLNTGVSIACTPVRLNITNRDIGSRGVHLSTAEEDDVAGDGDADGDAAGGDGARSSMSSGGRARSS